MKMVYGAVVGIAAFCSFSYMFPGRDPRWIIALIIVLGIVFNIFFNTETVFCSTDGDGSNNTPGLGNNSRCKVSMSKSS